MSHATEWHPLINHLSKSTSWALGIRFSMWMKRRSSQTSGHVARSSTRKWTTKDLSWSIQLVKMKLLVHIWALMARCTARRTCLMDNAMFVTAMKHGLRTLSSTPTMRIMLWCIVACLSMAATCNSYRDRPSSTSNSKKTSCSKSSINFHNLTSRRS